MDRAVFIPRHRRQATVPFVATASLALTVWVLVRPATAAIITRVDDIWQFLAPLGLIGLVAGDLVRLIRSAEPIPRRARLAPVFLLATLASLAGGHLIYSVYELLLRWNPPYPSIADVSYLSAYPFFFIGIVLLPGERAAIGTRLQGILDGLIVTVAAATLSWYFILEPAIVRRGATPLSSLVSTAYPLSDLVLVVCVITLGIRVRDTAIRRQVGLLTAGVAIIVATDSGYDYRILHGGYHTGSVLDVSGVMGYLLVGLAAQQLALLFLERPEVTQPLPIGAAARWDLVTGWFRNLPYAVLPLVGSLFLVVWHHAHSSDARLTDGVLLGSALLLGLVIVRQGLAVWENRRLQRAVVADAERLDRLNHELTAANARLEGLATTDPLTGLANHRAVMAALDQELERGQRYGRPFTIWILDLDHFKAVNDSLGHGAGDATLAEIAQLMRQTARGIDVLGRLGGEEFVAILPEVTADMAGSLAERLRASVAQHTFAVGGGIHLTCSMGLASYPTHSTGRDELLELADRALYAAKRLGRNQYRSAGESSVAALLLDQVGHDSREETALAGTVEALAALVDARDHYAGQHARAVSELVVRLALSLGMDTNSAHLLGLAGRLHDIGKVAVPDAVLQKPGCLTPDEWQVLRRHPIVGADVVRRVPALRALVPMIRGHHERWDGTGYPDGLRGDTIPLGARVLAVADAYGAMTSDRPYRPAQSSSWALAELRRCAGTQFDPQVVQALQDVFGLETDERGPERSTTALSRKPASETR